MSNTIADVPKVRISINHYWQDGRAQPADLSALNWVVDWPLPWLPRAGDPFQLVDILTEMGIEPDGALDFYCWRVGFVGWSAEAGKVMPTLVIEEED